jgi:hypothetical protein
MIEKPNNSIVLGEIKSKGLNKTDKLRNAMDVTNSAGTTLQQRLNTPPLLL